MKARGAAIALLMVAITTRADLTIEPRLRGLILRLAPAGKQS